jgi:hypothetical protein
MKRVYLTIVIVIIHLVSFSQQKERDKNAKVAERLIGSWKFDYALYSSVYLGTVSTDTSKVFHTDTIHFFSDQTFRFRSHDTANTDVRVHTGTWEISNKGKTLIHKKRAAQPAFEGPLPDLTFPIRMEGKDRIRIDYIMMTQGQQVSKPATNNTPVFFDRIR